MLVPVGNLVAKPLDLRPVGDMWRRAHPGRTDAVPGTRPRIEFSTGRSYRSYDEEMMRAGALAEVPPPPRFPPGFFKNTNASSDATAKGSN